MRTALLLLLLAQSFSVGAQGLQPKTNELFSLNCQAVDFSEAKIDLTTGAINFDSFKVDDFTFAIDASVQGGKLVFDMPKDIFTVFKVNINEKEDYNLTTRLYRKEESVLQLTPKYIHEYSNLSLGDYGVYLDNQESKLVINGGKIGRLTGFFNTRSYAGTKTITIDCGKVTPDEWLAFVHKSMQEVEKVLNEKVKGDIR